METTGVFHVDFPEVETIRALRGTIIAPSHPSLIDAPHFLARMPRPDLPDEKERVEKPVPWAVRHGWRATCPMTTDANSSGSGGMRCARGDNLLIFPEGTRTVAPPVNPFKNGLRAHRDPRQRAGAKRCSLICPTLTWVSGGSSRAGRCSPCRSGFAWDDNFARAPGKAPTRSARK